MSGPEDRSDALLMYVSPESFVPEDHPFRPMRFMTDKALASLPKECYRMYFHTGRPSVSLEMLLNSLLLQILYSTYGATFSRSNSSAITFCTAGF